MRYATALATLALVVAGCGDDNGDSETTKPAAPDQPATAAGAECIESWNREASPDVRSYTIAGVSERPVAAGTYKGREFSGSTDSDDVTVRRGDCVVAQVTSTETEYVFVKSRSDGGPPTWHSLEEEGTPLAKPEAQLEGTVQARLTGYGPEAKLEPRG